MGYSGIFGFGLGAVLMLLPVVAVVAFFAVSLTLYLLARRRSQNEPAGVSPDQMQARLVMLIVASVLLGIMLFLGVGVTILLSLAIAYM